ncbi:DUF2304 domain-containing protein [Herbaspirillum sp. RU 5E]|uniref:DUF2304 domain-containing protein n=1 Tax=Herbaspirillum sp. CAH-3 TaxID=2605746 RepID=UPI0012AC95EF|nr:DUF2304 domain-containing protein [Herbaspirillum sp. CAH-3]MBW9333440.1 DUF2304 domain-containing protein [Herbaspirillum sp. RU 5E]MRT28561.1 DUF2304 domain-containing protein [Herbaspirillum sp. CAH-3]
MITMLKANWPVLLPALALFVYTWKLVASDRINTRIGVGWLVALTVFILLNLLPWPLPGIAARFGRGTPLLGLAILAIAWLGLVAINNHVRISGLTVKLKLLDQELALLNERMDRMHTGIAAPESSAPPPSTPIPSPATAASEPNQPPRSATGMGGQLLRQTLGCAWICVCVYAFGVFTGFIPPQGNFGTVLTQLFTSLQAEYQH